MPNTNQKVTTLKTVSKGLVICNIGAGKGKTTAAMGTCIRAAGAGMNVYIMQFVKAKASGKEDKRKDGEWPLSCEIDYLNEVGRVLSLYKKTGGKVKLGNIQNEQVGLGFVGILGDKKAKALHVKAAKEGLRKAIRILKSGKWDVVFLDELISALEVGVLKESDVVKLIKVKPKKVHLILTGHNRYEKILELCDLVTKMDMVKHPYYKGILAQRGIDY